MILGPAPRSRGQPPRPGSQNSGGKKTKKNGVTVFLLFFLYLASRPRGLASRPEGWHLSCHNARPHDYNKDDPVQFTKILKIALLIFCD